MGEEREHWRCANPECFHRAFLPQWCDTHKRPHGRSEDLTTECRIMHTCRRCEEWVHDNAPAHTYRDTFNPRPEPVPIEVDSEQRWIDVFGRPQQELPTHHITTEAPSKALGIARVAATDSGRVASAIGALRYSIGYAKAGGEHSSTASANLDAIEQRANELIDLLK